MEAQVRHQKVIHIVVQRGEQQVKLDFTSPTATGLEIKTRAGGSAQDGLYVSKGGREVEVGNNEVVELREGEHFVDIPNGRVS